MVFDPVSWTLQSIINEVRGITGRPDTTMMTDQQCTDYINYYYQYVLPKELKIFYGYTNYEFFALSNIDQYVAPVGFQTLNPSATADGFPITWYIDPDTFDEDYPQQENKVIVATGTGALNNFTFGIPAFPVLARSVYVTDGTQIAQDLPTIGTTTGTFFNPSTGLALSGTIDYLTGSVAGLVFPSIPANGVNIMAASQTYVPARPQSILFYKQQPLLDSTLAVRNASNFFVIRPVPDNVYRINMHGIQIPPSLLNLSDVPFREDLGPLIAIGASLHIFKLFNQMNQYNELLPEYARFKSICLQDTYENYLYQRSVDKF